MTSRYNSPPNWPSPPEGWQPPPGWQPDPAWGPAPSGWNFWVEHDGGNATADVSASAPASPAPTSSAPPSPAPKASPVVANVSRKPRWLVPTGVGVVALLAGFGIGAASNSGSATNDSANSGPAAATATVTVTSTPSVQPVPAVTVTKTATATVAVQPTQTTSAPKPAQPANAKVLDVTGSGIKNTKDFTVASDEWTVAYAYDCTAFGFQGNFMVDAESPDGSGLPNLLANELGMKGQSSTVGRGAGTYYLSVNSECNWHVVVTDGA
jgi:hypothetical protein